MHKLIQFSNYFYDTYEPCVQLIDEEYLTNYHEKTASEAWDYIQHVKPETGKRFILVIAMGSGEYWGSNKNGDFFPEDDLKKSYKNFETTFDKDGKIDGGALLFKHHRNKLAKGHPWYGTIKKSFYNERMHRVELLLEVHEDKAPDIVKKIDNGDEVAVSMGVRIPYDICCICRNKAPTRKQYCQHLKQSLRKILPDGRKVYAINGEYDYSKHKKPLNFFDMSFVFRPADQTGYMLKKVAFFGDEDDVVSSAKLYDEFKDREEKIALLRKMSTIDKIIKGIPVATKDDKGELKVLKKYKHLVENVASKMKPLSDEKVAALSTYPMNQILSTLADNNIILTTPEFLSIMLTKMLGTPISPEFLKPLATMQGESFDDLAESPEIFDKLSAYDMFKSVPPSPEISSLLNDIKENRDLSEEGFIKKSGVDFGRSILDFQDTPLSKKDRRGMLHTETIIDPSTGKKYLVNMDALEQGQIELDKIGFGKIALSGLLLSGVYAALKDKKRNAAVNSMAPLALIAGTVMGLKGAKDIFVRGTPDKYVTSESGSYVPKRSVIFEKKSSLAPKVNQMVSKFTKGPTPHFMATALPLAGTAILNKYYDDRLNKGTAGMYRDKLEKNLDTAGAAAYTHPILTGGAAAFGANLGLRGAEMLREKLYKAISKRYF